MKNKKMLVAVLTVSLLLSMAGCGKQNETGSNDNAYNEETANNIGSFETQDIYGETVTQDIFAEYDLTLVNLFATWCGPCIQEMPELAQLQKDMRDKGVNIVAVVLDGVSNGQVDQNAVDTTKELADLIEAEFTFMIPDETNLNGRLDGVTAVPESFFVDKNGNMVGEPYVGARSYDEWKAIIEDELANK